MLLYRTISEYAEAEYEIEKSRFIAHVQPIRSYEEGQSFVNRIKSENKTATHNVPVIISGSKQEIKWASDDGEPSGTSGMPVLKMISDIGITNLAIVITRFFGGIKLGTGGLARAYTHTAKLGIEATEICDVFESVDFKYSFDYSYLTKLQNLEKDRKFSIGNIEYSDVVTAEISCLSEYSEEMKTLMRDLTSDKAILLSETSGIKKISV